MSFKTIYADPPWNERGGGVIQRGAQRHYPLMHTRDILNFRVDGVQVSELAEPNAHLYLWVTNNFLLDGLEVVKGWGFRYITMITWVKDRIGLGQYYRGLTEHCIFAVRGSLPYRNTDEGKRAQGVTWIYSPRGEHSAKPEAMRSMIELVSHPPYLELFARHEAKGWTCKGNEL